MKWLLSPELDGLGEGALVKSKTLFVLCGNTSHVVLCRGALNATSDTVGPAVYHILLPAVSRYLDSRSRGRHMICRTRRVPVPKYRAQVVHDIPGPWYTISKTGYIGTRTYLQVYTNVIVFCGIHIGALLEPQLYIYIWCSDRYSNGAVSEVSYSLALPERASCTGLQFTVRLDHNSRLLQYSARNFRRWWRRWWFCCCCR